MKSESENNDKRKQEFIVHSILFAVIMLLTLHMVFHGRDMGQIWISVKSMSGASLMAAVLLALVFTAVEGFIIWYLLREMGGHTGLLRCIGYAFVGFFFSGITPSATGGQPMQLYYMKKDGNRLADSSVALLTVAVVYKLVLVMMGLMAVLFWNMQLKQQLKGYYYLFLLGMALNTGLVMILLMFMLTPGLTRGALMKMEVVLTRIHILKKSETRRERIDRSLMRYQSMVHFLFLHKGLLVRVLLITTFQRCCVFLLPGIVYRGLGLSSVSVLAIACLQMSIYIAVDMLPLPGAQGITEAMYRVVFAGVFTGNTLLASLCVSRGVSFYLLMAVGLVVSYVAQKKPHGAV
ncbi:MAG: lysylphosphatidylglycerol synthase transmembrane domain-containing protein [Lachnospiraceae bacterium]|nr:lysylphosphatidylglycerol synthase transmembrane domain-containing protein [Lachnospiraceae bacterium]